MVSSSKILATTKDKPSEHLGVSNANLGDKKEAQNFTHQLREAPGTTLLPPRWLPSSEPQSAVRSYIKGEPWGRVVGESMKRVMAIRVDF